MNYIELPVFLDAKERIQDIAGYLDEFYDLYIIRYADHSRLAEFAAHSRKSVINAMSSFEHPCEALADAYWFDKSVRPLEGARIVIWGSTTNVLRSWYNIAMIGRADVFCIDAPLDLPESIDLVVTDGWPDDKSAKKPVGLNISDLEEMGNPVLLPTPPFTVGKELGFDPLTYPKFAGYAQKKYLRSVQKAIIRSSLDSFEWFDAAPPLGRAVGPASRPPRKSYLLGDQTIE